MFKQKPLRHFHVSANKVYLPGKKTRIRKAILFLRPKTTRAVYRISSGSLLAV